MTKKSLLLLFSISIPSILLYSQEVNLTALKGEVNSSRTEYAPSLSADGNFMMFESDKDEEHRYKLYSSRLINGVWSTPKPLEEVNSFDPTTKLIGGPSLSYDANQVYYFANFKGSVGSEDIYYSNRTKDGWSKPINAGRTINTRGYEGFPSLSSDGQQLFFIRAKTNNNMFCTQIVVSNKDAKGNWLPAKALPRSINAACEKCPRILSDNETLIFASNRKNPTKSSFDLYISRLQSDNTWSAPVAIDPLNTELDDQFATVSSKGDEVFLINNKTGNYDIYSAPLPMEFRPRSVTDVQGIILDEKKAQLPATIYIYKDGKLKNTGGLSNNSSDGKYGYTLTQGHSYQIITRAPGYKSDTLNLDLSTANSYQLKTYDIDLEPGYEDLKITVLNEMTNEVIAATAMQKETSFKVENDEKGVLHFEVKYGDKMEASLTKEGFTSKAFSFNYDSYGTPLEYTIKLKPTIPKLFLQAIDKDTEVGLVANAGVFELGSPKPIINSNIPDKGWSGDLKYNKKYLIRLRRKGYFSVQDSINLAGIYEGRSVRKVIPMVPLKVGNKLTLNNVYFSTGSAELTPESKAVLGEVVYVMKQNRNFVVEIGAHTDDVGNDATNMTLSAKRAESVKAYLVSLGILPNVLNTKGYGESTPVAPNNSDENRQKNRRVEFKITRVF